ncbi:MAG: NCS2 family permease [Pseudomonadota bacterium]
MMIARFFRFQELRTNWKSEILGGVTTFVTTAYIIVVNPAILEAAGIPKGPSMVATIWTAFVGTLVMGVYAKRPFAIAPYMGENAFVAYTVVKVLGYSWQTALGAIFIGGILFTLLTISRLRSLLAEAVPENLKYGFAVGIGLFLAFIGLNEAGIVALGEPGAPVKIGQIAQWSVLLSVLGFLLIVVLNQLRTPGALLIGILGTAFVAFVTGAAPAPGGIVSAPPSLAPIAFQLDIRGALTWGFFPVILTIFLMDFVDTMGTLIGVSARAGFLDEKGNLPEIEKPMLADALATTLAPLLGTTTAGAYIESAAGVEAGGRSGFSAVVTAVLFLGALFFSPLVTAIPPLAYGPALIFVGILMIEAVRKIDFSDFSESVPALATVMLMSFTYNIGIGIMVGFILYPLLKLVKREWKALTWPRLVLALASLVFFVFYPYH